MKIIRAKDYDHMSRQAANIISAQVILKPDCVLGLATGSSPIGTYEQLIKWYEKGDLDFSQVRTVNLDEYVGLDSSHEQSYAWFMHSHFFDRVNIDPSNTNIPCGIAPDEAAECQRYDSVLGGLGKLDLQLLGIGPNGHIGFNEPDTCFTKGTHKVALTETTIQANKRFFQREEDVPRFAYTMGICDIMNARRVVLVASGVEKADAVKAAFFGPITPLVSGSILQLHPDFTLVADEAALSKV
ncbi:MAG: glucosamine-6-phosphate deaminase [Clostridiales bacterium]|nr:glucosamine-6-phosphate deaminase [Clostridiales bacterium]